jgi:hypothetical protein
MSQAVDDVMKAKFGDGGIYRDAATFKRIYKDNFGESYLKEASDYASDVIECTRDICTYIYETHGRFPAHVDTIHAPGIWLQVHKLELEYYDRYFQNALTDAHRANDQNWPS